MIRWIIGMPAWILIKLVRAYQFLISPLLGPTCRFKPTCSDYFVQSIQKYGTLKGVWRGLCRVCRCHPWNPGGYDPP